jgi:hypothetical protein
MQIRELKITSQQIKQCTTFAKRKVYNRSACETWYLSLGEEKRFGVLDEKVLKIIFEPQEEEVTKKWKKDYIISQHTCMLQEELEPAIPVF